MPLSVQLALDERGAGIVAAHWERMREIGAGYMIECGVVPHVSIAVFEGIRRDPYERAIGELAARAQGITLTFAMIGIFPSTGVVAIVPKPTPELLALHRAFAEQFAGVGIEPHPLYLPDEWVPHCTLAMRFPPKKWDDVVRVARTEWQRFVCVVRAISLVEFGDGCDRVVTLHEQPIG